MPLPSNLEELIRLLLTNVVALGAVVSALLAGLFTWWDGAFGEVASPVKTLIAAVAPVVGAGLLYGLAVAFLPEYQPASWAGFAQALVMGILAAFGGQVVYGTAKRLLPLK